MQLRETKKAVIYTKFLRGEKKWGSREEIMEQIPQNLFIENKSKNKINNLQVKGNFSFNNKNFSISHRIKYLNPYERVMILIRLGDIMDKFPKLFEEHKFNDKKGKIISYLKIPKETLKIKFNLIYRWGWFNKQEDSYEIEWLSLKSSPNLKDHPRINSWNKRGKYYIEKIKDGN